MQGRGLGGRRRRRDEMSIRPHEGFFSPPVFFFFFVLQIQFKGARRRGSSRSCRANAAAQGHMSQPCDIKEEQERGLEGAGGGCKNHPPQTSTHSRM